MSLLLGFTGLIVVLDDMQLSKKLSTTKDYIVVATNICDIMKILWNNVAISLHIKVY